MRRNETVRRARGSTITTSSGQISLDHRLVEKCQIIDYRPTAPGTGYVPSAVMLEFGARSTGEPFEHRPLSAMPPCTCTA
jgi:hypothetical protein